MSTVPSMITDDANDIFDVTTALDALVNATVSNTEFNGTVPADTILFKTPVHAIDTGLDALINDTVSNTEFNGTISADSILFKPPSPAYLVCNMIVTVIGLIGNCMVLVLIRDIRLSLLSYPVYLGFLAVSDSVLLVTSCIHESLRFFHSSHLMLSTVIVCNLWRFVRHVVALLSPWLVVGLTVDRFYCVVFPLARNRLCTRRKAAIVCSCLTVLSAALITPLMIDVRFVKGPGAVCIVNDKFVIYFASVHLILKSVLPCLLILVLNLITGIHIQRSVRFRKRFTSTTCESIEHRTGKSLRPLMLISILAFVTLLPGSITESVVVIMLAAKSHTKTLIIFTELWSSFNILYLINFGQNFYILIFSSAKYRQIMKGRLTCTNVPERSESVPVRGLSVGISESSTRTSVHTNRTSFTSVTAYSVDGFTNAIGMTK